MVNLMGQRHWLTDAPIAGKASFLGVCVKQFLEEITIGFGRLSEGVHLQRCMWASSKPSRAPKEG